MSDKKIVEWAVQLEDELAKCYLTFQSRGDNVYAVSKELAEKSPLGPIQALNICMQIELEFPGRLEECIERADNLAKISPVGMIRGIMMSINSMRS